MSATHTTDAVPAEQSSQLDTGIAALEHAHEQLLQLLTDLGRHALSAPRCDDHAAYGNWLVGLKGKLGAGLSGASRAHTCSHQLQNLVFWLERANPDSHDGLA